MLPLLGHWYLDSGLGLQHKICLVFWAFNWDFEWRLSLNPLCGRGGRSAQKTKQRQAPHGCRAHADQLSQNNCPLFTSFFTDTCSHSHFAYSSNSVDPYFSPAFLQLEVLILFLTIWLLFLLPFSPAKHLDSFNKSSLRSSLRSNLRFCIALRIKQKSSLSSHFLLTFPVFFLSHVVSCFSLLSSAGNSVFIA